MPSDSRLAIASYFKYCFAFIFVDNQAVLLPMDVNKTPRVRVSNTFISFGSAEQFCKDNKSLNSRANFYPTHINAVFFNDTPLFSEKGISLLRSLNFSTCIHRHIVKFFWNFSYSIIHTQNTGMGIEEYTTK